MIFHGHKAIFLHVGKAAGTSVEKAFEPNIGKPSEADYHRFFGFDKAKGLYLQHATAGFMKRHVDARIFNTYFKFTLVRNPFSRLVSVYNYQLNPLSKRHGSFENFVLNLPKKVPSQDVMGGSHTLEQIHYSHLHGQKIVDEILYFEDLPECFKIVQRRVNLDRPIPHMNKSGQKDRKGIAKMSDYTPKMIEAIQQAYAKDFEVFGYHQDIKKSHAKGKTLRALRRSIFI